MTEKGDISHSWSLQSALERVLQVSPSSMPGGDKVAAAVVIPPEEKENGNGGLLQ